MALQRKKRIIVFEIRIACYTDYVQDRLQNVMRACIEGMAKFEKSIGRITEFEVSERVLDGKTFAEIKE